MKKLYEKNEVTFAVVWIVLYCVIFGSVRGSFGEENPWHLLTIAAFAAAIAIFLRKNGLEGKYGLTAWPADQKRYWYFLPMLILATGNLWGGIKANYGGAAQIIAVLSMALVGYVEEVIFRGFLFRGMLKGGNVKAAIVVSAMTFGIGHIINLFTGQDMLKTAVQIVFAVALGFIFTMVYYKSGALLPCILAHSMIDVFSTFAVDDPVADSIYVISTIVIALIYCLYLSKLKNE